MMLLMEETVHVWRVAGIWESLYLPLKVLLQTWNYSKKVKSFLKKP